MNRQKLQILPFFLFLTLVSGVLFVTDRNKITDPVRSKIEYFILKIRGGRTVEQASTEELTAKIISLENERNDLTEENRLLRKQLQAPLPPSCEFIPGIILTKEINEEHNRILIAGGGNQGIEVGMPVVSEKILIGTIREVTPRMSHVQLLSDSDSSVAVKTNRNARGIVFSFSGTDTKYVQLDRILQSEPLEVGDVIETSGEDDVTADLLIGTVTEILTESRDPFQKARVELAIDPQILERVFVVKVE
jgi:rod shape-determining protein MreC